MRSRRGSRGKLKVPNWVIWALGAAFGLAAIFSGVLVYASVRNLIASLSTAGGLPTFVGSGGEADPEALVAQTTSEELARGEAIEPWDGSDRVTVLFMGLDYRDWVDSEGPPRTDSMMLVTVDPVSQSAGMLSIPRDLWTEIPGFEHNRINTAYFLGESYNLPGGGPALAMKTVENPCWESPSPIMR